MTRDLVTLRLPGARCAVVPVRHGALPAGGAEAVAEAGGDALLVGSGTLAAAGGLPAAGLPAGGTVRCAELGDFAPGAWAAAMAPVLAGVAVVVLPASADGRDLAPRLAHALRRPLLAGASRVGDDRVEVVTQGGRRTETFTLTGPVVATLLPGVRGVPAGGGEPRRDGGPGGGAATVSAIDLPRAAGGAPADPVTVEVLPPDPATMDLSEARRVVAGGAGLGDPSRFAALADVAAALGAAPGATRVVADAGWVPAHRYIGTTGVTVSPDLYLALGVSGAVQHLTGVRHPRHVVAVNTDPSAPIMGLADLAVVADAPGVLDALLTALRPAGGLPTRAPGRPGAPHSPA